ncbi:hypothetical protein P7K49_029890 [Saguinus oedipus]|uniref:Uncharacterized protein n=1 Tax=Saguinus oedipus TaxID=9490 RepID=A0ABQ9U8L1_SAGOE|nr:hypothetical protein P7K49_029890 [Saguinus oedipus]
MPPAAQQRAWWAAFVDGRKVLLPVLNSRAIVSQPDSLLVTAMFKVTGCSILPCGSRGSDRVCHTCSTGRLDEKAAGPDIRKRARKAAGAKGRGPRTDRIMHFPQARYSQHQELAETCMKVKAKETTTMNSSKMLTRSLSLNSEKQIDDNRSPEKIPNLVDIPS